MPTCPARFIHWLLTRFLENTMPEIPPDLLTKLQVAEDQLAVAFLKDADAQQSHDVATVKDAEATAAHTVASAKDADAMIAHQDANSAASEFITAFRAHFGLPVIDPLPPPIPHP